MMTHKRCVAGGGLLIRDRAGCQSAQKLCPWESATGVAQSRTLARPGGGPEGGAMYQWQATVGVDGEGTEMVQKGAKNLKLLARICGYLRVIALICGFGGKIGPKQFERRGQDAGATQLRADGESESVSRNETCASRIAVPGRQRGLGGKSGGFRSKSRRKYRVIPHNPA